MVPDFNIEVIRTHSDAVVRVTGELDLATAPRLRGEFIGLVDGGVRSVTVDLSKMGFIDSTGLSVLVSGLKRFREHGGELTLQCPNLAALKVFEIAGLTSIFSIS